MVMASRCHGLCDNELTADGVEYALGWKVCKSCWIKVKTDSIRCYCCKYPLRTKRRKTKNSKKELIVKRI